MTPAEFLALALGIGIIARFSLKPGSRFLRDSLERFASNRSEEFREEFLRLSDAVILSVILSSGFGTVAIVYYLCGNAVVAILSGGIPVFLLIPAFRAYRRFRRRAVVRQLPAFLDLLAGFVRSGRSVPEAISGAIPLLPQSIRQEISWICRLNRLGMSAGEALLSWEKRLPLEEITLVVRPLRVALASGGNVAGLIERTRDVLRFRQRNRDRILSLTAQARIQAIVLTLLPLFFLAALCWMDENFLSSTLNSIHGRILLLSAGILLIMGWLVIRSILRDRS